MYKITEIVSQTEDKISLMVSFNDKAAQFYEIDLDVRIRTAQSLASERAELVLQTQQKATTYNKLSDLFEKEEDEEKKAKYGALRLEALDEANRAMEALNQAEAEMASFASETSDVPKYIDSVLSKVAKEDKDLDEKMASQFTIKSGKLI